jgi:iron complex transport system substrate-binding protein
MFRKLSSLLVLCVLITGACAPAATPTGVPPTAAPTAVPTSAPTAAAAAPIELTDGLGHVIKLAGPAQRIISLAPSNTEILFALGAGEQVIGRDSLSDFPPEAKQVADIGTSLDKLNAEAIVAQKPDLVLAADISSADQIKTLQGLGLTVYQLPNPKNFEELYQKAVGQLTGRSPAAGALITDLKARVAAIAEKMKAVTAKPKVFYEIDATDPTKPFTTGPGTFMDMLLTLAGGQNIGSALKDQWAQISSEELVAQNPEIILLGDAAYGVSVASVGQRAGWAGLAAIKANAVYTFDDNLVSRPGPRLVDGLETLARLVHPDLFK